MTSILCIRCGHTKRWHGVTCFGLVPRAERRCDCSGFKAGPAPDERVEEGAEEAGPATPPGPPE